jgi:hypothetical protein
MAQCGRPLSDKVRRPECGVIERKMAIVPAAAYQSQRLTGESRGFRNPISFSLREVRGSLAGACHALFEMLEEGDRAG